MDSFPEKYIYNDLPPLSGNFVRTPGPGCSKVGWHYPNRYPEDRYYKNQLHYNPLGRYLSSGYHYPPFKQPRPAGLSTPPRLQILRIDGGGMINDVIMHTAHDVICEKNARKRCCWNGNI